MVRRRRGDDGQRGDERGDDFGRGGLNAYSVCSIGRRRQRGLASRVLNGQGPPCRQDGGVRGRHRPIYRDGHGDATDLHQQSVLGRLALDDSLAHLQLGRVEGPSGEHDSPLDSQKCEGSDNPDNGVVCIFVLSVCPCELRTSKSGGQRLRYSRKW